MFENIAAQNVGTDLRNFVGIANGVIRADRHWTQRYEVTFS
jgi:hypothetical protein